MRGLTDVTSAYAVLALMGPRARAVLAALTRDDVGNAAFPFGQARRIQVAGAPVLALRVTYVGELGWELHVPVEFAATVYAALMNAGAAHGIANAGYRAIESLRLEKGYRAWGADIGPDHTPFEAGLGWAVKLEDRPAVHGPHRARTKRGRTVAEMVVRLHERRSRAWCCSDARPSIATASELAGSAVAATATPSGRTSAWVTCAAPKA